MDDGSNFLRDDASFGFFVFENTGLLVGQNNLGIKSSTKTVLTNSPDSTSFHYTINDAEQSFNDGVGYFQDQSLYAVNRSNSSSLQLYKDGVQIASTAARPSTENPTSSTFRITMPGKSSMCFVASNLSAAQHLTIHTEFETFRTGLILDKAILSLQGLWNLKSNSKRNTFVDANTAAILSDVDNLLQTGWDHADTSNAKKNTFVDANTFEIITHIYDSANATAVIARMTNPVIAEEAAMSKFVTLLGAMWDLADDFHSYAVPTETNALTGWKMKMLTAVNAPTHTPGVGFAFGGVDEYINSNYNPTNDAVKYLLGDALVGAYIVSFTDHESNWSSPWGAVESPGSVELIKLQGTDVIRVHLNTSSNLQIIEGIDNNSLYISTYNGSNVAVYKKGLSIGDTAETENGIPNTFISIGAGNHTPVIRFFNGTISSFIVGAQNGFDQILYKVQLDKLNSDLAAI